MARKNGVEDLEKELLGYLPKAFVLYYYELVEKGLVQYTSPLGHAGESGGKGKKRFNTHNGGLKDPEALKQKQQIDKLLRSFVRDGGSTTKAEKRPCPGCGKNMGATWLYCAWCGDDGSGGTREEIEERRRYEAFAPRVVAPRVR